MFLVLRYVLPMLQSSVVQPGILARKVFLFINAYDLIELALTAFATVGVYKLLAALLISFSDRVPFLKRFIFGPVYMEGTWIGRFDTPTGQKFTVEHFEQKLNGIVIRGWASNENGSRYAEWTSIAASVDAERGLLTYTYDCDILCRNTKQQGIGVFQFERSAHWRAPTSMTGYSADLIDGERSENHEFKIEDKLMDLNSAMAKARELPKGLSRIPAG